MSDYEIKESTASFTWRDVDRALDRDHVLYDSDRDPFRFRFVGETILGRIANDQTIGGVMLWNATQDHEHGHIVMLTGQTRVDEYTVMENAYWMVSCGAVYAARRVGWKSYKSTPHAKVKDGRGDEYLLWLLRNNAAVSPSAMKDTVERLAT